jgi:hypothetical protein
VTVPEARQTFSTAEHIEKWLNRIIKTKWFREVTHPYYKCITSEGCGSPATYAMFVQRVCVIETKRSNRGRGNYFTKKITLPKWAFFKLYALHELAHIAAQTHEHGPIFCRVFLNLVRQFISHNAYRQLGEAYERNKVKIS